MGLSIAACLLFPLSHIPESLSPEALTLTVPVQISFFFWIFTPLHFYLSIQYAGFVLHICLSGCFHTVIGNENYKVDLNVEADDTPADDDDEVDWEEGWWKEQYGEDSYCNHASAK